MGYLKHYLKTMPEERQSSGAIAYLAALDHVKETEPKVVDSVVAELNSQRNCLKMIASENYSSLAVQTAMGNLLTDKYSEGYPYRRFYAGCENVDSVEALGCDYLKEIFGCDHAYVQPHSGADANLIAFWAILVSRVESPEIERLGKKSIDELTTEEYDQIRRLMNDQKMLGMSLGSGGHLTHGFRRNISSKMMRAFSYDVDPKTHLLDYSAIEKRALEVKPDILVAGYSAYPRLINFAKMREIADRVGAVLLVDMAHFAGLVAGGAITGEYNPVPYAHIVTSTTHKTMRGPRGGMILSTREFGEVIDRGCPLVMGGPLPHVMAAKAVAFKEVLTTDFKSYAAQIIKNAQALSDRLLENGVRVITGGTDNHLLVFDTVESFGLTGRQAETALREAGITVNRNSIPFDPNGAWYTSGVRVGTPALTSRGLKEDAMRDIADLIVNLLKNTASVPAKDGSNGRSKVSIDPKVLEEVRVGVAECLSLYPLYPELGEVSLELKGS